MPDEPLYDPDRTVPEDLDFSDPDVALAYLNHPNTERLSDDIGRLFRSMPASDQQRDLGEYVTELEQRRTELMAVIKGLNSGDPARSDLNQLLQDVERNLEGAKLRMLELDD